MNVPETFSFRIASPSATWPLSDETTEYDMRFWAEGAAAAATSAAAPRRSVSDVDRVMSALR
jgi:hypothetical protein